MQLAGDTLSEKEYNDLSVRGVSLSGPVKLSHLFGLSVSGTPSRLQVLLCGHSAVTYLASYTTTIQSLV